MTSDEGKSRGFVAGHQHGSHPPPPPPPPDQPPHLPSAPQYGTFQGVPTYPPQHPPPPAMGFPQPAPPPGAGDPSAPPPHGQYYSQGYQSVPEGYAVAEGRPVHEGRLPCCGLGLGWCLFIIGFFLGGIPWYVGAILLMCSRGRLDYREKPGYIVCTIAAILETVGIILGSTSHDW